MINLTLTNAQVDLLITALTAADSHEATDMIIQLQKARLSPAALRIVNEWFAGEIDDEDVVSLAAANEPGAQEALAMLDVHL